MRSSALTLDGPPPSRQASPLRSLRSRNRALGQPEARLAPTLPECGAAPTGDSTVEAGRFTPPQGSGAAIGPGGHSALVSRNITVRGHRTSVRLEPQLWDILDEMCVRERCTPHDVCSFAADRKLAHGSLVSSLRVVILDYFRTSATEEGHKNAGHGQGLFLCQQQERLHMRTSKADGEDR